MLFTYSNWSRFMVYQAFFFFFLITLISRKKLGGYKIMRYTVGYMQGTVVKNVFLQKYFVTCGCNRVHLPSPYSDGGADCHSKKTRPGANIFFYIFSSQSFCGTRNFTVPYNFQTPFTLQEVKQNGSLASFIAYVSRPPAC